MKNKTQDDDFEYYRPSKDDLIEFLKWKHGLNDDDIRIEHQRGGLHIINVRNGKIHS